MSDETYKPNVSHPDPHQRTGATTKVAAGAPAVKLLEARADRRGVALTSEEAAGGADAWWGHSPDVTDATGNLLPAAGSQTTDSAQEIWVYSAGAPVIAAYETFE